MYYMIPDRKFQKAQSNLKQKQRDAQGWGQREGWTTKGHKKTFGGTGNVYLDCDNEL